MNDNNQEKHQAAKKKLKIIGYILLVVGAIFTVIGFVSFFSAFGGNGMPKYFWCAFIGLPLLGVGGSITALAHKQEISRYMKNESVPVINEASEEISPAIRNIASAVKEGIQGDKKNETVICPKCGAENDDKNNYCGKCGAPLSNVCTSCGNTVPANNAFCGHCGHKL